MPVLEAPVTNPVTSSAATNVVDIIKRNVDFILSLIWLWKCPLENYEGAGMLSLLYMGH